MCVCMYVCMYAGFGHTELWSVVQDPFGLVRRLSVYLDISLTFGLGRFFIPFGPPARKAVLMAFGDPIQCPRTNKHADGYRAMVDRCHARMLTGFKSIFDTHKKSYGWKDRDLHFV